MQWRVSLWQQWHWRFKQLFLYKRLLSIEWACTNAEVNAILKSTISRALGIYNRDFVICLWCRNVPFFEVSVSQSLLITSIRRCATCRYQPSSSGCPEPKTMNSNASRRADKSSVLILCHTYQLITYLLFQFFPSLQPSCRRTLHLWIR